MIARVASAFAFGTVLPTSRNGLVPGTVTALPVVGAALGLIVAAALWLGRWAFGPHSLLPALFAVAIAQLLTRGLHLDGLADTADGLGCYGSPERARSVMREGGTGPFGVAAVVVNVLAQTAALSALPLGLPSVAGPVVAMTAGRVAAVLACRRGIPAAPGSALGALMAGSQPVTSAAAWTIAVAVASIPVTPRPWQGPIAVLAALLVAAALVRHCVRRFGGVTGDVMGAAVEVTTTLTVVGLVVRCWVS